MLDGLLPVLFPNARAHFIGITYTVICSFDKSKAGSAVNLLYGCK